MASFLALMIDPSGLTPHGFCLAWDPVLIWLEAISDVLIGVAYYSIPLALVCFVRRRTDLAFPWILWLFAAFILACGTTHVFGALTLWVPAYWPDAIIKALTAAVSLITAFLLWPLVPKALALPSPAALRNANAALQRQVEEHETTTRQLAASEARYREFFARAPVAMHSLDRDMRILAVSDEWLAMLGYAREEVIGRRTTEFQLPASAARAEAEWAEAKLRDRDRERQYVCKSGEVLDLLLSYTIDDGVSGRSWPSICALVDVTARKRAEAALREAEKREAAARLAQTEQMLKALGEASPDLLYAKDAQSRMLYANPATLAVLGRPAEEVIGRTDAECMDDREQAEAMMNNDRRIMDSGVAETVEEVVTDARSGTLRVWQSIKTPLRGSGTGEIVGLVGVGRDVTEPRLAERALAESEARFRATFEQAAVGFAHVSLDGPWLLVNRRVCEMLGYSEAELQARTFHEVTHPDDLPIDLANVRRLLAGEIDTFTIEKRYFRKDGSLVWVNLTTSLLKAEDGTPRHFVSVIEDISARKATEAALAESRARLQDLLTTLDLATVLVRGLDGTVSFWAHGCERLYGWSAADMVGRAAHDILRTVFPVPPAEITAALLHDGEWSGDLRQRCRDGREIIVAARKALRRDQTGQPLAVMESLTDVTELRRAEEDLRRLNEELEARVREEVAAREAAHTRLAHAQRMEALGQLAGGIAHDFNNVLQTVQGAAALIERRPVDAERSHRLARAILGASERGTAITHRLLVFSRYGDLRAEPVDVAGLLTSISEILGHSLGGGIDVRVDVPAGLPPLLADKGQLETVLINLATNARDAMEGSGVLTLRAAGETVVAGEYPLRTSALKPGAYVRLSVADTGTGMDAATLARAMEPFFTTKPTGKGTGLGLAMAQGFAEQSGGALHIESALGSGTTVTLWLPVAHDARSPTIDEAKRDGSVEALAKQARVLVVDDEDLVRGIVTEQLQAAGYAVHSARSGADALALLDAGEDVALILSDLSMPGMDGVAVIREAQRRRPGLPAILLTGFATEAAELAISGATSGRFSVLRKPVDADHLADRIAVLLENQRIEMSGPNPR